MEKDTKTVEVDEAVVKAVAVEAAKLIDVPSADDIATKVAEIQIEASEKTAKKAIHEGTEKSGEQMRTVVKGIGCLPKELRFA